MAAGIVGRNNELAAIAEFLDQERLPSALVLEGDAGIGKTTLWRAGVEAARERSQLVLVARPASVETEMPFTGLGDLLGERVEPILDTLPPPQRRALEAAMLFTEEEGAPPQPNMIAAAVLSSLRALSSVGRVLVAIDDVQWLDPPSASALEFAIRRIGEGVPLELLVGWRTVGTEHPPLGLAGALDMRVRRLRVGPLSLGAIHRVITDRLGHSLPRPSLTRIYEVSGGNPLFALELAQAIERRGALDPGAEVPLPTNVAEALEERLATLPADTREALLAVASLGTATLDILERALGPEARAALQPAFDARMLVLEDEQVRFAHPLTRAAVYSEAWPARRRELHRVLAHVVPDPDERARHLALGMAGPDAEVAAALEGAAHRARFRGAPDAAAALAEQAWRGTPPEDAGPAWRRGLLAAEYHMQSGDIARLRSLCDELLPLSKPGDERSQVLALLSLVAARTEGGPAARSLVDRALAEAESTHQRQSVESDYTTLLVQGGDVEAGALHAREALRLADQLDDPTTVADALALVAACDQVLGRGLRRDLLQRADRLAKLRRTDGMHETTNAVRNIFNWGVVLSAADEFADARARLESAQRLIEAEGVIQSLPELLRVRADLECWAGDWDLALECVEACEEAAEQTGQPQRRENVRYAKAFVAAHRGEVDSARELAAEGVVRAERVGMVRELLRNLGVLGFLELSLGDPTAATSYLQRAADVAASGGFFEPGRTRFQGDLAEALVEQGRLDDAEKLVAELEVSGETTGYPWTIATANRCRALVYAAGSELEVAERSLEDALAAHERLGNPFERARTLFVLGRVQRRTKRRAHARRTLGEALTTFEEMGARLWAEHARHELSRIPGRRGRDFDELTEAEQRIAALVAEGYSNKEAASALFVSAKTVEAALTRIYRKLGVRSRTELAHHLAGASKE